MPHSETLLSAHLQRLVGNRTEFLRVQATCGTLWQQLTSFCLCGESLFVLRPSCPQPGLCCGRSTASCVLRDPASFRAASVLSACPDCPPGESPGTSWPPGLLHHALSSTVAQVTDSGQLFSLLHNVLRKTSSVSSRPSCKHVLCPARAFHV